MSQHDSRWQRTYKVYRDVERSFGNRKLEGYVLRRGIRAPALLDKALKEARGYGSLDTEFINAARKLAEAVLACRLEQQPYQDVYQAALWIVACCPLSGEHAYRGQRLSSWRPIASFHRADVSENDRRRYRLMLATFVTDLSCSFPDQWGGERFSPEECVAIAQHYSKETGIKTWMLDFTTDPFIALFFATYESTECSSGDIGCISQIAPRYWKEQLDCNGILGYPRLIQPKGVARIEAQKAGFFPELCPGLIEQDVPLEIRFYQVPGLVFEDPHRGVTMKAMLPEDDDILTFARQWAQDVSGSTFLGSFLAGRTLLRSLGRPAPFEPPRRRKDPADIYYAVACCWFERLLQNAGDRRGAASHAQWVGQALRGLAILHACLQELWKDVPRPMRAFARLATGVSQLRLYLEGGRDFPSIPNDAAVLLGKWYWEGSARAPDRALNGLEKGNELRSLPEACRELANRVAAL